MVILKKVVNENLFFFIKKLYKLQFPIVFDIWDQIDVMNSNWKRKNVTETDLLFLLREHFYEKMKVYSIWRNNWALLTLEPQILWYETKESLIQKWKEIHFLCSVSRASIFGVVCRLVCLSKKCKKNVKPLYLT